MKKCPYCDRSIQDNALICKYCKRNVKSLVLKRFAILVSLIMIVFLVFTHRLYVKAHVRMFIYSAKLVAQDIGGFWEGFYETLKGTIANIVDGLISLKENA